MVQMQLLLLGKALVRPFSVGFLSIMLRDEKTQKFMNLREGNMTVQEYGLEFNQLSRYAPHMVADSRS